MSRFTGLLPIALVRPFNALGGFLLLIAAMLPWATFLLNEGPFPEKATLQFFDAPFELTGFRWHVLLFGLVAIIVTFIPLPGKDRVLRALGWGGFAIGVIVGAFIVSGGGGVGAITAADGNSAFGSIVAAIGGLLLILASTAKPMSDIPNWPADLTAGLSGKGKAVTGVVVAAVGFVAAVVAFLLFVGPVFDSFEGFSHVMGLVILVLLVLAALALLALAVLGLTRLDGGEPKSAVDRTFRKWTKSGPAWLALLLAFAGVLWFVAQTLTAGGIGGAAFPHAGALFLAFLGFAGGLLGLLHGVGLARWVGHLSERHRAFSILVLLACAFLLPFPFLGAGSQYWMQVAATIGVYAATAIGLNIVVGLAGLLDLGYVAFMGIGAFVAANLSGAVGAQLGWDLPFPVAALIAAVIAGIFGAIVGSPTLRVRGDYLAIVTLAFGEIFTRTAQNNIGGMTGGASAIPGVPQVSMFGTAFNEQITVFGAALPSGVLYYFMIVLVVGGIMAVFANLKNSRVGRAWIAVREDEDAARAMGIRTGKVKILAFLVGAMLAGLAGAIFVHRLGTASYDSFKFLESVTLLAAVILGGMGTIPGAVLGASLLFVLPEKLREFDEYRLFVFGLALVFIMRFRPQGLVPDRIRRAEFAGETAEGKPIGQVEEQAVLEHEQAEQTMQLPAVPKEDRP